MFGLPADHSVTGWNTALVGLVLVSAAYVFPIMREAWHQHRSIIGVMGNNSARMLTGFSILCLGVAIRIGGWIPWRGMRFAGDANWSVWWADHSYVWTSTGTLFAVIGTTLIMWPALQRITGRWYWCIAVVAGSTLAFFVIGVAITDLVARILE